GDDAHLVDACTVQDEIERQVAGIAALVKELLAAGVDPRLLRPHAGVGLGVRGRVEHGLEDHVVRCHPGALRRVECTDLELLELEQVQIPSYRSFEARRIRRTSLTAAATMASRSSGASLGSVSEVPDSATPCPSACPASWCTTARITSS